MGTISGGTHPTQINARRELGNQVERYAKSDAAKNNKNDNIVNATGSISSQDLEGALKNKDNGFADRDHIYLQLDDQVVSVNVTENKAMLEQLQSDLKSGKRVQLADLNLNISDKKRETKLDFKYRPEVLRGMSQNSANQTTHQAAELISNSWREFERTDMKDGSKLDDGQRLALAVEKLQANHFSAADQKNIIGQLFYGETAGMGKDHLYQINRNASTGNVDVSFQVAADFGDLLAIEKQSFVAPTAYTGLDDNRRALDISAIKAGQTTYSAVGNTKITGIPITGGANGSIISQNRDAIAKDFLTTDNGRKYSKMTPEARQSSPAYQQDLAGHLFSTQSTYLRTNVFQMKEDFKAEIADPTVSDQDLALMAMNKIMGTNDPNRYMKPHTTMLLEDEAAVELFMQEARGVGVNFDASHFSPTNSSGILIR